MNLIRSRIAAWFASKGGFAHACAALFAAGVGAYYAVPPFRALLDDTYNNTPVWVHTLVLAGLGLYAWYKRTSSPAGARENVMNDRVAAVAQKGGFNANRP
jgi:hypothetical protein